MTFVSYAQTFEDVRLWRAFREVRAGRYIDIGAQDPVRDSISLAFYERGWRGIHVEPTAAYAEALRNARPDETVIEAVVTNAPGPIKFFEIPGTGLSTGIADIAQGHRGAGWDYREILVPAVTLAGLFECYGPEPVHWLKIDVEGMEAEVISSWGDHPARPAVLIIEATAPLTQIQTIESWYDMIVDRGYSEVVFDGLSRFFVHKEYEHLRDAIYESPNVFDGFHVSDQHFTTENLIKKKQEEAVSTATAELQSRADAADAAAAAEIARVHADYAALEGIFVSTQNSLSEANRSLAQTQESLDQATRRLAETENSLGETTKRLAETENSLGETTQRLANAESVLYATAQQLSEVEAVLGDTSQTLIKTETALNISLAREAEGESRLAEVASKLDALKTEHGQLLRKAGYLEGQLEATTKAFSEQLAGMASKLERAEEERQAVSTELAAATNVLTNLRAAQSDLEQKLLVASGLLANAPDIFGQLPPVRSAIMRWVVPRSNLLAIVNHAKDVAHFKASGMAAIDRDYLSQLSFPVAMGAQGSDNVLTQGNAGMAKHSEPITSVQKLLEPHDREFIHAAYQSLLGRAPDPEGERYYLAQLRSGIHKLAILKQLRRSGEGRAFIPGVAGLDAAIKRYIWATFPVIGLFVRALMRAEGDSTNDRKLRALANELGWIRQQNEIVKNAARSTEIEVRQPIDPLVETSASAASLSTQQPVEDVRFQPAFCTNAQNAYSLDEFMQLHDTTFVKSAYLAILHREPDNTGLKHYVLRIREGTSKVRVLSDLIQSQEGRSKGTTIFGLDTARRIEKVLSLPIIGGILSFLLFSLSIQQHLRDMRLLENHMFRLVEETHRLHRQDIQRLQRMKSGGL